MKRHIDWWSDEIDTIRPGMHIRTWREGSQTGVMNVNSVLSVSVGGRGCVVQRIERRQDNTIRVALVDENGDGFDTAWMQPDYPVEMGVERSIRLTMARIRYDFGRVVEIAAGKLGK